MKKRNPEAAFKKAMREQRNWKKCRELERLKNPAAWEAQVQANLAVVAEYFE